MPMNLYASTSIAALFLISTQCMAQEEKVFFEIGGPTRDHVGYVMTGNRSLGKVPLSTKVFSPSTTTFYTFSPNYLTEELSYANADGNTFRIAPRIFESEFKSTAVPNIKITGVGSAFGTFIFGYDPNSALRACENLVLSLQKGRIVDTDPARAVTLEGVITGEYRADKTPYIEERNYAVVVVIMWTMKDVNGNVLHTKACPGGHYFGSTTIKKRQQQEQYTRQQAIVESLKNFMVLREVQDVFASH